MSSTLSALSEKKLKANNPFRRYTPHIKLFLTVIQWCWQFRRKAEWIDPNYCFGSWISIIFFILLLTSQRFLVPALKKKKKKGFIQCWSFSYQTSKWDSTVSYYKRNSLSHVLSIYVTLGNITSSPPALVSWVECYISYNCFSSKWWKARLTKARKEFIAPWNFIVLG